MLELSDFRLSIEVRSRGLIALPLELSAQMAQLNGVEVDGRAIRVDYADKSAKRPTDGEARPPRTEYAERRPRPQRADDTGRRVYVGNLGYGTSDGQSKTLVDWGTPSLS